MVQQVKSKESVNTFFFYCIYILKYANIKMGDSMKKKGFTLVELLAVIVVLGIILVIVAYSVLKNLNDSKEKAKYMAAKDIVSIAVAYIEEHDSTLTYNGKNVKGVKVNDLIIDPEANDNSDRILESNVTNPKNGKANNLVTMDRSGNEQTYEIDDNQLVIVGDSYMEQAGYKPQKNSLGHLYYSFNGYVYILGPEDE